jgi:hypothetical protein
MMSHLPCCNCYPGSSNTRDWRRPSRLRFLFCPMRKSKTKTKTTSRGRTPAEEQTARQHELATKLRGELAELEFALKAVNLGFGVANP